MIVLGEMFDLFPTRFRVYLLDAISGMKASGLRRPGASVQLCGPGFLTVSAARPIRQQ